MKLNPGERSILAYFDSGTRAEAAEHLLRQAGFTEVQFDQVGRYGYDEEPNRNRPAIAGGEPSEVTAVLYGNERAMTQDVRVLLNATPSASGMAGVQEEGWRNFLVTVVTTDDRVDEAVKLIQENGGRV